MTLRIRPTVYRREEGWLISGRLSSGTFSTKIFCRTRPIAEAIKRATLAGDRDEVGRLLQSDAR